MCKNIGFRRLDGMLDFLSTRRNVGFLSTNGHVGFSSTDRTVGFLSTNRHVGLSSTNLNVGFSSSRRNVGFSSSRRNSKFGAPKPARQRNIFWSLHLFFEVRIGSFLEIPWFFENKKEPQRSHESFGGSIASRSLICVGKQRIWYSVITPRNIRSGIHPLYLRYSFLLIFLESLAPVHFLNFGQIGNVIVKKKTPWENDGYHYLAILVIAYL